MSHEDEHLGPAFGYLSVLESTEHGFFGGYLIISDWGRPLEFHCTAPVLPSRAQQILYGPTLRPYLFGDEIGPALLGKAKLTPELILTDQPAALCPRFRGGTPLVLVVGSDRAALNGQLVPAGWQQPAAADSVASSSAQPVDEAAVANVRPLVGRFCVAGYELELAPTCCADRQRVLESLIRLAVHVDLAEPFERIHEAIREAQRIGGQGSDIHGQAA